MLCEDQQGSDNSRGGGQIVPICEEVLQCQPGEWD